MSSKTLTATVRINTSQAEKSLDRLSSKINKINKVLNSTSTNSGIENQLKRGSQQATQLNHKVQALGGKFDSLKAKTNQWLNSHQRVKSVIDGFGNAYNKVFNLGTRITNKVREWWSAQKQVESSTRSTQGVLGSIWSKLKGIAATYLGIMGGRALINTSDTITSAENKLNYVNAQALGDTGTYDAKTIQATQEAMDKMYTSAQKVRMSYTDMMNNVSKSMALAGDAFQNNTDNAIRFQEIMAEAYAVGGASAAEMSSSMYQLIQALGAGTLAGDELRSVREGAPLAYKAIEKFAQGVYNTEESLKELGSQGKITSDMVVAAIMNAGNEMDSAFAQTAQTFAQTWNQIKNVAKKAFEPVSRMMSEMLNKAIDNGLIQKLEVIFVSISKALQIIFKVMSNVISWIAENWFWLQHVIVGALIFMGVYFVITASIAIASAIKACIAWAIVHWQLLLIVFAIGLVIYALYLWQQGVINTTNLIVIALLAIGAIMFLLFGWQVALIFAVIALVLYFFQYVCAIAWSLLTIIVNICLIILNIIFFLINLICGLVMLLVAFILNAIAVIVNCVAICVYSIGTIVQWIIAFIVNLVMACVNWILALITNVVNGIINGAVAIWNVVQAVGTNIGIAFENAWNAAASAFWNFIADCLDGLAELARPINDLLAALGKGGFSISGLASSARSRAGNHNQKGYVDVGAAWDSGLNTKSYTSLGDAWSKGWNTMDFASLSDAINDGANTMGYTKNFGDYWNKGFNLIDYIDLLSVGDAWDKGLNFGSGVKDSINDWGAGKAGKLNDWLSGKDGKGSVLDKIGNALGLDFGNGGLGGVGGSGIFPDPSTSGVGDSYKPPSTDDLLKGVDNIDKNTGSVADSMDLTDEDLEYLRKIAEMEWKKEFTTATIKVDMSNYNNINGENDLDGIVTKLTDRLYEELQSVADGVYV